jgi:hypothetical protein
MTITITSTQRGLIQNEENGISESTQFCMQSGNASDVTTLVSTVAILAQGTLIGPMRLTQAFLCFHSPWPRFAP